MNGKTLNRQWNVNAKHALYRASGDWYHQLTEFPGALFDRFGYIIFETEDDYRNCPNLQIKKDVHVPKGIAAIPGYVRVVGQEEGQGISSQRRIEESKPHYEGRAIQVELTRYERDPEARRKCLVHYGTSCLVCSLSFGKAYGDFADGLIHVHHLTPIADIGEAYEVDPIRDLRPVCPNCHAVIHRRSPPYTIEEVKAMIKKARNGI